MDSYWIKQNDIIKVHLMDIITLTSVHSCLFYCDPWAERSLANEPNWMITIGSNKHSDISCISLACDSWYELNECGLFNCEWLAILLSLMAISWIFCLIFCIKTDIHLQLCTLFPITYQLEMNQKHYIMDIDGSWYMIVKWKFLCGHVSVMKLGGVER